MAAPPRFSGDGDAKRPLMPTLLRHPQPPSNISDPSSSLGGFLIFLRRCVGDDGWRRWWWVTHTCDSNGGRCAVGVSGGGHYISSGVFVESGDFLNVWLVFLSNLVIFECLASVFVESGDFECLASNFESGDFGRWWSVA
ncbi:hypothetical protein HanRHA438_Chr03g0120411 [Helianthus annuus]|uniref:Uncharacterized protein n=1 Tax=Helianthus annuus TaxID=4232 RepID=A0A9K3NWR9_HELAN|nr:hypothetical protein HanXRQr2_Chr03g0109641 [Helianthus annuus]KAJ0592955.1 hypothetical protein HanHA300_Chr03g0091631 [Helianthus annuus]KAJ0607958.1 hypothetical protein HanHA89_Chr03g0103271 [Helianthus annuus]KAJ0768024.1 hypothetical protein HanLR1_Chr03g0096661 [Helianthus annuus]KAJ0935514.1 hypothetical protein HanRHA438_Chr03g0120411 [Helianthus annuus]